MTLIIRSGIRYSSSNQYSTAIKQGYAKRENKEEKTPETAINPPSWPTPKILIKYAKCAKPTKKY